MKLQEIENLIFGQEERKLCLTHLAELNQVETMRLNKTRNDCRTISCSNWMLKYGQT